MSPVESRLSCPRTTTKHDNILLVDSGEWRRWCGTFEKAAKVKGAFVGARFVAEEVFFGRVKGDGDVESEVTVR